METGRVARPEQTHPSPDEARESVRLELEGIELDLTEQRILDFERSWTARPGSKEAAIRAEFGLSTARYYQILSALIDSPVALRTDPLLVRRLQRVRDARAGARAARTFRIDPTPTLQDPTD
jgi:hypothetical protein